MKIDAWSKWIAAGAIVALAYGCTCQSKKQESSPTPEQTQDESADDSEPPQCDESCQEAGEDDSTTQKTPTPSPLTPQGNAAVAPEPKESSAPLVETKAELPASAPGISTPPSAHTEPSLASPVPTPLPAVKAPELSVPNPVNSSVSAGKMEPLAPPALPSIQAPLALPAESSEAPSQQP